MSGEDEEDLEAWLERMKSDRRYADFFDYRDRRQKELGIVRTIIEAGGESALGLRLLNPRSAEKDPPDVICDDGRGGLIAIEVTELVSEVAIAEQKKREAEARRRGDPTLPRLMQLWPSQLIRGEVDQRLRGKDRKRFEPDRFSEIVVCLHTAEPMLTEAEARAALEAVEFGPFVQITAAVLLMSYMPGSGYPLIRLRLREPAP